jgi:hypothetical protein
VLQSGFTGALVFLVLSFKNTDYDSQRRIELLRPISVVISLGLLLTCAAVLPLVARDKSTQEKPPPATPAQDKPAAKASPTPDKPVSPQEKLSQSKTVTAEQVAESVVFIYGSRAIMEQIRRNGIERGRITRITADGHTEEATYERRFVRGAEATKDKIRVDQKMPTMQYSLVYGSNGIASRRCFATKRMVRRWRTSTK